MHKTGKHTGKNEQRQAETNRNQAETGQKLTETGRNRQKWAETTPTMPSQRKDGKTSPKQRKI